VGHLVFENAGPLPVLSGNMQKSYIRFGRKFAIPSTVQILDELKTDFVPGYVPISRGFRQPRTQPAKENDTNESDR
jgi:hypothetical protein